MSMFLVRTSNEYNLPDTAAVPNSLILVTTVAATGEVEADAAEGARVVGRV